MHDKFEQIQKRIIDADLVLIGIGELLSVPTKKMDTAKKYEAFMDGNKLEGVYPYLQQIFISENSVEILEFYNRLYELVKEKNYYVLTTNVDDVIFESKLDKERIVAPCGSIHSFVCQECMGDITYFSKDDVKANQNILDKEKAGEFKIARCPKCGKVMTPNVVSYEYYDEKGYLDKWTRYTKWLQGTVNKKLCILELGVGMNYPTVIRWPNERIVTYNNKAYMYRIHDKWYQLSEGIGESSESIADNPMRVL